MNPSAACASPGSGSTESALAKTAQQTCAFTESSLCCASSFGSGCSNSKGGSVVQEYPPGLALFLTLSAVVETRTRWHQLTLPP